MRKALLAVTALAMVFIAVGCKDRKTAPSEGGIDSLVITEDDDSTIYGMCGDATSMNILQLIADSGDTLSVFVGDDGSNVVQGGLLSGDRIAMTASKDANGEWVAQKVINLTTLLGKWTSIDKNFEIVEGGEVKNNVKAEQNPWTSWKITNGNLLLGRDTFQIDNLGPDSLLLENSRGIYAFKRQGEENSEKQDQ